MSTLIYFFLFFFWKAKNIYIILIGKPVPVVPEIEITRHLSAALQSNNPPYYNNSMKAQSNYPKEFDILEDQWLKLILKSFSLAFSQDQTKKIA